MFHAEIYQQLKVVARNGNVTTYSAVGELAGLDMRRPPDRQRIGEILSAIDRHEVGQGRPQLAAVVIRKGGKLPGKGFFETARSLGCHSGEIDPSYWERELKKVYQQWSRG